MCSENFERIWSSPFVEAHIPQYKYLYLVLCLTCASALGIIFFNPRRLMFETGLSRKALAKGLALFASSGQIVVDGTRILITDFIAHTTGYDDIDFDEGLYKEALQRIYRSCSSARFQKALCLRYPNFFDEKASGKAESTPTQEQARKETRTQQTDPAFIFDTSAQYLELMDKTQDERTAALAGQSKTARRQRQRPGDIDPKPHRSADCDTPLQHVLEQSEKASQEYKRPQREPDAMQGEQDQERERQNKQTKEDATPWQKPTAGDGSCKQSSLFSSLLHAIATK